MADPARAEAAISNVPHRFSVSGAPSRFRRQASWLDALIEPPELAQNIQTKSTYLANFDWGNSFWHPLNASQTLKVLAVIGPGGTQRLAQLWVIGKIDYAALMDNQYPGWTLKLCLTNNDQTIRRMMLRK